MDKTPITVAATCSFSSKQTNQKRMAKLNITQFDTRSAKRTHNLPVQTPIPDSGQVENSTGGFTWQLDDWGCLNRFLILGAEGGTYYVAEQELLKTNHDAVVRCVKADGKRTVKEIVDVSFGGRAYKNDPAIFALALVTTYGDLESKRAAFHAIPKVCRIGTHLFHFCTYVNALRGWGTGLRKAVSRWYQMPPEKLAMQAIKYQQRDGYSHRDVLRLAHPPGGNNPVLRWMVGGKDALGNREVGKQVKRSYGEAEKLPAIIEAFEEAKTADEKRLVKLISEHDLPREAVPTEKLNSVAVWEALLQNMPLTAMIRNLGKMTSIGLIKPLSEAGKLIKSKLSSEADLKKSRVHPMQVLLALRTYEKGHGLKGSLMWTPVPVICQALDAAFYKTFSNAEPTGKPMLIALDVSGSMASKMAGSPISSCEAVAALSLVHASIEEDCHIFGFADTFRELGIHKGMTIVEACRRAQASNFGSTDISLAIQYAIDRRIKVGGFLCMTDNECNTGRHSALALREYRERFVSDARSVFVATTGTSFTVNDPKDRYGLDCAGFDASIPVVISDFIRGEKKAVQSEDQ